MKRPTYVKLSIMMLFQYAVWGVWMPVLGAYLQAPVEDGGLGFSPGQVGWIIALATSLGAISAPFIAGQFADRYFNTERFLAVLLLIGGVITWVVSNQESITMWFVLMACYSIIYTPTIALTNSLAFAHVENRERDFPLIRVWGTIGWIAVGWIFPLLWLRGYEPPESTARLADALKFSGVMSIGYAIYCLAALPATPPKRAGVEKLAFAKAFALFRKPSFAVLVAACLPIAIIHNIYFIQTGPFLKTEIGLLDSQIGPAMSIGQFAEIFVMAALGFMIARLGIKRVVIIGATAYVLRYAIFGSFEFLPVPVVVASQALHGFCFSCFFAAGFIYVDRICDDDIRNSAQTVFGIIILGVGPLLSGPIMQLLEKTFLAEDGIFRYQPFWYTLSGIGFVTTLFFAAFFREEKASDAPASPGS